MCRTNYFSIFTIIAFVFLSQNSQAQFTVGGHIGMTYNYITNPSLPPFNELNPKIGFSGGASVSYQLKTWFSLESGFYFIQKNYQIKRSNIFDGVYTNYINSYLQIPLTGKFYFNSGKISYFVQLGIYGGYWISGRENGTLANILNSGDTLNGNPSSVYSLNDKYNFDEKHEFTKQDNRFEFGWTAGLGALYQLSDKTCLQFEINFGFSTTDHQKNYQVQQVFEYNNTFGFQIGYLMKMKGVKNGNPLKKL